jgi:hypothetical protein
VENGPFRFQWAHEADTWESFFGVAFLVHNNDPSGPQQSHLPAISHGVTDTRWKPRGKCQLPGRTVAGNREHALASGYTYDSYQMNFFKYHKRRALEGPSKGHWLLFPRGFHYFSWESHQSTLPVAVSFSSHRPITHAAAEAAAAERGRCASPQAQAVALCHGRRPPW